MAERIRVSGFLPPFAPRQRRDQDRSLALVRPANLIGPLSAAWLIGATLLWGTPHLLLFSRSSGFGSYRFYDDCANAGLDGRMVHRRGASCPLFRLLKQER